ncbi:MAG: ATP-grasp domain-containing protein [Planctomycetia bacterium]|nr:ATP-grasp domain-containing protein [Planctomycetia bacterium]
MTPPGHLDPSPAGADSFTIMLTAAGRRVELMDLVRQSISELGLRGRVLATDITFNAPAMHRGDLARTVPPYRDSTCLAAMLRLCDELKVGLILPTFDPDLPFLARHRERFEAAGTRVMVSSLQAVEISYDKKLSHDWLAAHGFPTLRQTDAHRLMSGAEHWEFPLFIKPRFGSASIGARAVRSLDELNLVVGDQEYVAQEIAPGQEYTVDVYLDRSGKCRCAVPRWRIETRAGEVSKGMTVRSAVIEDLASRVAETLPDAAGIMNIQIFHDRTTGRAAVSEINPRLGGGYPLSHQAGAPMVRWAIEEAIGRSPQIDPASWRDGLVMLRYDDSVFVSAQESGLGNPPSRGSDGSSLATA